MSHMMLKQTKTPEEIEAKRRKQEEVRRQLDAQVQQKAEQKLQDKQQVTRLVEQQQASTQYFEQLDSARLAEKSDRAQRLQHEIMAQMEKDAAKKQQERAARTAAPKPMHPSSKAAPKVAELQEKPVLSTMGATIRFVPVP